MDHFLRQTLMSLCLTVGLGAQIPSGSGQKTSSTVEVEPTTTAPPVPLREALGLAEKAVSLRTHHVVKAELRARSNRSYWALLFFMNSLVDGGTTWVTVDMERRVIVHGTVITDGPEPNLNQIPLARPHPTTVGSNAPEPDPAMLRQFLLNPLHLPIRHPSRSTALPVPKPSQEKPALR